MKPFLAALTLWSVFFMPPVALGAGLASNANFIVIAPDQPLADAVLAEARVLRKHIALAWLDEELPPSVGRTIISVELSESEDKGLFWPIDHADRKCHKLWLVTSRHGATGSTLAHEMTHVVLTTRFGGRLPAWAEEGLASLQDDVQRVQIRRSVIDWYARTGNWPSLDDVLAREKISNDDQAAYSTAASLASYLLTRDNAPKLLDFAMAGDKAGWDTAARKHYGVSVQQLQTAWQSWAGSSGSPIDRVSFARESDPIGQKRLR